MPRFRTEVTFWLEYDVDLDDYETDNPHVAARAEAEIVRGDWYSYVPDARGADVEVTVVS